MRLTDKQLDYLRVLGHDLRPTVNVGAGGLTNFVLKQIDAALSAQELVKISVPFGDRKRRSELLDALAPKAQAALIQRANNAAVLYRPAERPVIELPQAD
jgi:RNA-binding protein